MIRKLIINAWSTLIGFLIFGACLVLPVIGWVILSVLICWCLGRPVVAFVERRIPALK